MIIGSHFSTLDFLIRVQKNPCGWGMKARSRDGSLRRESESYSQQIILSNKKQSELNITQSDQFQAFAFLNFLEAVSPIILLLLFTRSTLRCIQSWFTSTQRLKLSKVQCQQTVTTSINSKIRDMIFILSKICSAMFMRVASEPYVTHWATLFTEPGPCHRTEVES